MTDLSHVLVFKTTIQTPADKGCIEPMLNAQGDIQSWSIDQQDVDCVLRIITPTLTPHTIIQLVRQHGFACAELD